jgi:hypothetical protein
MSRQGFLEALQVFANKRLTGGILREDGHKFSKSNTLIRAKSFPDNKLQGEKSLLIQPRLVCYFSTVALDDGEWGRASGKRSRQRTLTKTRALRKVLDRTAARDGRDSPLASRPCLSRLTLIRPDLKWLIRAREPGRIEATDSYTA